MDNIVSYSFYGALQRSFYSPLAVPNAPANFYPDVMNVSGTFTVDYTTDQVLSASVAGPPYQAPIEHSDLTVVPESDGSSEYTLASYSSYNARAPTNTGFSDSISYTGIYPNDLDQITFYYADTLAGAADYTAGPGTVMIGALGMQSQNSAVINGTAAPDSTVTVSLNGSSAGSVLVNSYGQWSFTPSAAFSTGTYSVTASETDPFGYTYAIPGTGTFDASRNTSLGGATEARTEGVLGTVLDGYPGQPGNVVGGSGINAVSYANAGNGVIVDLPNQLSWDGSYNHTLTNVENVIGSRYNDVIVGTSTNNLIDGDGGADWIIGGGGNDTVSFANSQTGVIVDLPNQLTWDGRNNDTLSGIQNVIGSRYNDVIVGTSASNLIDGDGGADFIVGGGGNDTVSFASSQAGVIVDLPNQLTWDGRNNDTLSGIQNVIGSMYNDTIVGTSANNLIDGDGGADSIIGGGGSDTLSFASSQTGVIVDLPNQLTWDGRNNDTLSGIQNVVGSMYNDTIVGTSGNNVLDGDGGADLISGGGGNDTVSFANSQAGVIVDLPNQLTWDGRNNDTLSGIQNVIGSRYNDVIVGTSGDNVIDGDGGSDTINGGGGDDTISFASAQSGVRIDLGGQQTWDGSNADTLSDINNAIGSQYNDTLIGSDARNGAEDHTTVLTGGGGTDTFAFVAGFGHEVITDFVAGGPAHDTIQLATGIFTNNDPLSAAHDVDGNVVISANGQDDITLIGVQTADLSTADFRFS